MRRDILLRNRFSYLKSFLAQLDILDEDQVNTVYRYSSDVEKDIGASQFNLGNYNSADEHYERAITYAKLMVSGGERTELLYEVLMKKGRSLNIRENLGEAREVYEEAYNLMATLHYPEHPIVLATANSLVPILIELQE